MKKYIFQNSLWDLNTYIFSLPHQKCKWNPNQIVVNLLQFNKIAKLIKIRQHSIKSLRLLSAGILERPIQNGCVIVVGCGDGDGTHPEWCCLPAKILRPSAILMEKIKWKGARTRIVDGFLENQMNYTHGSTQHIVQN